MPVSTTEEIQVKVLDLSRGSMNFNTGKVQWTAELKFNETKQYLLKYTLKYPKDKKVAHDLYYYKKEAFEYIHRNFNLTLF